MKFSVFVKLLILSILIKRIFIKASVFTEIDPKYFDQHNVKIEVFPNVDRCFLLVFFTETRSKMKSETIFGILLKRCIESS